MSALGGWEGTPRVAVGLSGGPDSAALLLLALGWTPNVTALIVDHGLRPEGTAEVVLAGDAARSVGAAVQISRIPPPRGGARARAARMAALEGQAAAAGCLHLLLAHTCGDQAETVLLRASRGSRERGLAAIPPVRHTARLRILRPLLGVSRRVLLEFLAAHRAATLHDPTNSDPLGGRSALRAMRLDRGGSGPATLALAMAARCVGRRPGHGPPPVLLRPEGFAILPAEMPDAAALAHLAATVGGGAHAGTAIPEPPSVFGGLRLCKASRFCGSWLLIREESAVEGPVAAEPDQVWDRRFLLRRSLPGATTLGALGRDAEVTKRFRLHHLPAVVRRVLPALRSGRGEVLGVLGSPVQGIDVLFCPALPLDVMASAQSRPLGGCVLAAQRLSSHGGGVVRSL
jgi:tRNA(Ile)-lysidine synthase